MGKYLDYPGLSHFWGRLKEYFKITTNNSVPTIHIGNSSVTPVTKITAGAGLNTTSADTGTDGGFVEGGEGTINLSTTGVTANSYGPSANITPAYGATFDVPQLTIDKYGRVTAASTKTVKIPDSDNSDTKVTQAAAITTNEDYPIILGKSTATTAVTDTVNKSANLKYNPSTKALVTGGTVDGYALAAASAKGVDTSISSGSTSTNLPTTKAVEERINAAIAAAQTGATSFQGVIKSGTSLTDLPTSGYKNGQYWVVGTAGTYAGVVCEVGDTIFCVSDYNSSFKNTDFNVLQTNIETISTNEIDALDGLITS